MRNALLALTAAVMLWLAFAAEALAQVNVSAETMTKLTALKRSALAQAAENSGTGQLPAEAPAVAIEPEATGLKVIQALGLCIGVLLIGAWFFRRFWGSGVQYAGRRLKIREKLSVSPRTSLVLVEMDGRPLVLALGSEKVTFCEQDLSYGIEQTAIATEAVEDKHV